MHYLDDFQVVSLKARDVWLIDNPLVWTQMFHVLDAETVDELHK